jgi:hypothetical protein
MIESLGRISVSPPLELRPTPRGINISLLSDPGFHVRGAIIDSAWNEQGEVSIPDNPDEEVLDSYNMPTWIVAQECDLNGLQPGNYVWLKLGTSRVQYEQRAQQDINVPYGDGGEWANDAADLIWPKLWKGQVIGWIPGDPDVPETITTILDNTFAVDGYIVAFAGKDGAVPGVSILPSFWARLDALEGSTFYEAWYTFTEVLEPDGRDPKTGTAAELGGCATLSAGTIVRIFQTSERAFTFRGTPDSLSLLRGPGIALTAISANTIKISVDLATNPGLMFNTGDDCGQLEAKVDTVRGLGVDADGIFVNQGAGITFDGVTGHLKADPDNQSIGWSDMAGGDAAQLVVLPNNMQGIHVDCNGVGASLGDGLCFDTCGNIKLWYDEDHALVVDEAGLSVVVKQCGGITGGNVSASTGLEIVANCCCGIAVDGNGVRVKLSTAADVDLNFDTSGGLKHSLAVGTFILHFCSNMYGYTQDATFHGWNCNMDVSFSDNGHIDDVDLY